MSAFKVGRSEKKGLSNKLLHRRGFGPVHRNVEHARCQGHSSAVARYHDETIHRPKPKDQFIYHYQVMKMKIYGIRKNMKFPKAKFQA